MATLHDLKIMKGFLFSGKYRLLTDNMLSFTEKYFGYRVPHVTFD
jgi:hypothetical protein